MYQFRDFHFSILIILFDPSEAELQEMVDEVDEDGNGEIGQYFLREIK